MKSLGGMGWEGWYALEVFLASGPRWDDATEAPWSVDGDVSRWIPILAMGIIPVPRVLGLEGRDRPP